MREEERPGFFLGHQVDGGTVVKPGIVAGKKDNWFQH